MQDYYKVLEKGSRYACCVCGQIFEGWGSRHQATRCCPDKKPYSQHALREAEDVLAQSYHREVPRLDKRPGEGFTHKDRWGHWHRGKRHTERKRITDYHHAMTRIQRQMKDEELAILNSIMPIEDAPPRTPLQKLAYSHHKGNYAGVRRAAEEMASQARQNETGSPAVPLTTITFMELNLRFLHALCGYRPKVAKDIMDEVKADLKDIGREATLKKWARFLDLPEEVTYAETN